jgi:hypothetical protein
MATRLPHPSLSSKLGTSPACPSNCPGGHAAENRRLNSRAIARSRGAGVEAAFIGTENIAFPCGREASGGSEDLQVGRMAIGCCRGNHDGQRSRRLSKATSVPTPAREDLYQGSWGNTGKGGSEGDNAGTISLKLRAARSPIGLMP